MMRRISKRTVRAEVLSRNILTLLLFGGVVLYADLGCDDSSTKDAGETDVDTDTDTDSDTDSDTDTDAGSDSELVPPEIKVVVTVPEDFDGVPQKIENVFFESDDFSGEPYQQGYSIDDPDVGVGKQFVFETGQAGLNGEFYMAIVLYCEGGGDGDDLVPGVDWVGIVETPLSLSPYSGTVDAGTVELMLYEQR